ncbi:MAG: sulfatase-like hydrolase/transferase, partial [Acidobacteria bacterium]|nr:sulfatase-like hydrolase/transferase [Acidobacteriota bacterium]
GELAIEWLESLQSDERWFLFLHLYDAHGPYRGDGRYLDLFRSEERGPRLKYIPEYQLRHDDTGKPLRHLNDYIDRYDAEIRYQDEVMGDVLAALDLSRTLVVVVADHGETLDERSKSKNLSHATGVHDEQIRIPFVVHSPGIEPASYREVVETVDILPTVLELLEIAPPSGDAIQAESLVPLLRGRRQERLDSLGFSAVWARQHWQDKDRSIQSVRSRRWKLVFYPGIEADRVRLFDLAEDPGEHVDVGDRNPEIRDRLLAELEAWHGTNGARAEEVDLTPEEVENLKALGYLN